MITLLVDEAYAFDFAAILGVKFTLTKNNTTKEQFDACINHIKSQLGETLTDAILNSDEYKKLFEANMITFQWVDKAKTDSCRASDVDRSNYNRCKARKALQEKFFPGKYITEIKYGYKEAYEK